MFRSILLPVDGSPFSEQALPLAELVGRTAGTKVHLGHVHAAHGRGHEASSGEGGDPEWDEKERYLSRLVDRLKVAGVQADQLLMEGKVVNAIEEWAEEMGADLIVMATHGRAGLERLRLGSVAESLVSRGLAPMLLLHPGAESGAGARRIENVVVALDRSAFAQTIIEPLLAFGAAVGVKRYTLVHVTDDRGVGRAGWEPVAALQNRAFEHLEDVSAKLAATGAEVEVRVVAASDPSRGILDVAEETGADLIAMTTHGMTGVRPTLLGSVAAKVLHAWEGPLLLRRPAGVAVA